MRGPVSLGGRVLLAAAAAGLVAAVAAVGPDADAQAGLEVTITSPRSSYDAGEPIPFTAHATIDGDDASGYQIGVGAFDTTGGVLWGASYIADTYGAASGSVPPEALGGVSGSVTLLAEVIDDDDHAAAAVTVGYNTVTPPPPPPPPEDTLVVTLGADAAAYRAGAYAELDGRVTRNGVGVSGVLVVVFAYDTAGAKLAEVEAVTGADGWYTADLQLPATDGPRWRLRAVAGYSGQEAEAQVWVDVIADRVEIVTYPPFKGSWGPEAPIYAGDVVSLGGVVTRNGEPLGGATVLISLLGRAFNPVPTDAAGRFTHHNLPTAGFGAGDYLLVVEIVEAGRVLATTEVPLTLRPGPSTMRVALQLGGPYRVGDVATIAGVLTASGAPHSDWLEIDFVGPTGATTTFAVLTGEDGRFELTRRATMPGPWTVRVFHYPDRTPIPEHGVFTVVEAGLPPPVDGDDGECPWYVPPKITDVAVDDPVVFGGAASISGRVVDCHGDPVAGAQVELEIPAIGAAWPYRPRSGSLSVVTSATNGSFHFLASADRLGEVAFWLRTDRITAMAIPFDGDVYGGRFAVWGAIELDLPAWPAHDTSVGGPTIVAPFGIRLAPGPDIADERYSGRFEVLVQLIAPDGQAWTAITHGPPSGGSTTGAGFRWEVPFDAPSGVYEVVVYANHSHASPVEATGSIEILNLTPSRLDIELVDRDPALPAGAWDPWWVDRIDGVFRDARGGAIGDAEVTVTAESIGDCPPQAPSPDCSPGDGRRFVFSARRTDSAGALQVPLGDLYLFDEGRGTWWEVTVTAAKRNVAAAVAVLHMPTWLPPLVEIVALDPPPHYLASQVAGPEDLAQRVPLEARLTLRYRTLSPAAIDVGTGGAWAVDFGDVQQTGDRVTCGTATARVAIDGASPGPVPWGEYFEYDLYGNVAPHGSRSPWVAHNGPSAVGRTPVSPTLDDTIEVVVAGDVFDVNTPGSPERRPCHFAPRSYGSVSIDVVLDQRPESSPPPYHPSFTFGPDGRARGPSDSVLYQSHFRGSLTVRGTATVGRSGGRLDAVVSYPPGTAIAKNLTVQLRAVRSVPGAAWGEEGAFEPTDFIAITPSTTTGAFGRLDVPISLGAGRDPCDPPGSVYIEVTASGYPEPARIPVRFECVPDLTVRIDEIWIAQAAQLHDRPLRLAAGKPTTVRVYLELDGAIYDRRGAFSVEMAVRMGSVRLEHQIKTVIPGTTGASVSWDPRSPVGGGAGIGPAAQWVGSEQDRHSGTVPVDFVFTPRVGDLPEAPIVIEITADLDGRLGDPQRERIEADVKRMKRLEILFIPVDMPGGLSPASLERYVDFVRQTYPVASVTPRIMPGVESRDMAERAYAAYPTPMRGPELLTDPPSMSNLVWIADGIDTLYDPGESADVVTRVVGVVAADSWPSSGGAGDSTGVAFATGIVLLKEGAELHVLAHELGHTLGLFVSYLDKAAAAALDALAGLGVIDPEDIPGVLRGSEQYQQFEPAGKLVSGLVTKDGHSAYIVYDSPFETAWKARFTSGSPTRLEIIDFMGAPEYEASQSLHRMPWVTSDTYSYLVDRLADPEPVPILQVSATLIGEPSLRVTPGLGVPFEPQATGPYSVELLTADGGVLHSVSFGIGFTMPVGYPKILLQIPDHPAGTRIVLSLDGEVLATQERSASAPLIASIRLAESGGVLSIAWEAHDADGDHLRFDVELVSEGGRVPLGQGITQSAIEIDAAFLPGGDRLSILVSATDGFWRSELATAEFSVAGKAPVAVISAADEGGVPGTLWLRGHGYDLEQGVLEPGGLRWESDVDGLLGTGGDLVVSLSPGRHVVTLTATDVSGKTGTAVVEVVVTGPSPDGNATLWLAGGGFAGLLFGLAAVGVMALAGRSRRRWVCAAGHPARPGTAFCSVCGYAVVPPPPQPRSAARQIGAVTLVAVFAAGGGAAGWLVARSAGTADPSRLVVTPADGEAGTFAADPSAPPLVLPAAAALTIGAPLPQSRDDPPDPANDPPGPYRIGTVRAVTAGLGDEPNGQINDVAVVGDRLIAVGYTTGPTGTGAAVWESSDGASWATADPPPRHETTGSVLTAAIAFGDDGLVAMGRRLGEGTWSLDAWVLETGSWEWSAASVDDLPGTGETPSALIEVEGGLLAVGYVDAATGLDLAWWTSQDGRSWRSGTLPEPGDQAAFGMAIAGGTVIAVGVHQTDSDHTFGRGDGSEDGAVWIWDGSRFVRVLSPAFATAAHEAIWDVVAAGDGFVAGGRETTGPGDPTDAVVWTSPDGMAWNLGAPQPALAGALSEVIDHMTVAPDGSVIAVGRIGGADPDIAVWHSPDGLTWELAAHLEAPGFQSPRRVVITGESAVIVGASADHGAVWLIEPA